MLIYTFNSLKDFILAYSPSLPFLFKLNYLAEYYALDLGSSYSLKASSLFYIPKLIILFEARVL